MQKIIERQDEVIKLLFDNGKKYARDFQSTFKQFDLEDEILALKSRLAEAWEEKKLTDEQIQQYVTDRFSDSHLLPEIIAFRAIKYYRLGLPPMNGNKAVLD